MNTNRRYAVAALIAAGLLWGTTVPLSKLALEWLSPGWLTAARFGLAAAVLLAAILLTAGWTSGRAKLRAAFTPKVLAWGMLGYGGSVMVQNAGISRTSVTHAALLIGATPVLVAIIAAAWHRTVARPVAWVGFVVSLLGIGLVTAGGGGGGATMAGDGLVLASLLLGAAATVAQGRLLTGRDPVAVTAVQFLGAAVGALLVTVFTEGAPTVPGSPGPVLAILALTVGGTVLPFTLFAFGQSRVSAEVAGAFLNLEPLVGAIVGAAAFGDPVGLVQVAGGAAIVAGIGLSSLPLLASRRRSQAAPLALAPAGAEPLALAPAGAEPLALAPAGARPALAGAGLAGAGLAARERGTLPDRTTRTPRSLNSGVRHRGRNGVFVVVSRGKFGAGRPGGARPTPGRAGTRRRESARPAGSRPGGRAAERPPARGQGRGGRGALDLVQVRASSVRAADRRSRAVLAWCQDG
jgi:O-acetylserine/cysteine efflux transporter